MSICIIFNPTARGEKARKFQKSLEALPRTFALKPTDSAGAARTLATQAIREGFSTIVAAGGDGTLNEVLNGIGDAPDGFQRARLGVLPLGTINVFARELRLPTKLDDLWPLLESAHEISIDIGRAEFSSKSVLETRLFLQLAGAGLDARAVQLVNWELKKKIGRTAYIVAALQAMNETQPRLSISNGTETLAGRLILIGNGRLYGGTYPIFHKSDLRDGVLDAVVFDKVDLRNLPSIGIDLLFGRLFKEGQTAYLQGSELMLTGDSGAALQVDGEFAGELPARITVLPRKLRVVSPPAK